MVELTWENKRTEVDRVVLPFQTVEVVNEPREKTLATRWREESDWRNKLIWGDNKWVMASVLNDFAGKVNLIYIDPPFATGQDFSIKVTVGDEELTKEASVIEEKAYRDTWGKGLDSYLQTMYDRLVLMRELLAEDGSIYVHCDWHVGHHLQMLMDEIFGKENFQNQIVWYYYNKLHDSRKRLLPRAYDTILYYVKNRDSNFTYHRLEEPRETPVVKLRYVKVGGKIQNVKREDGTAETYIRDARVVDNVWRIRCLQPANKEEWVGFETQKPVNLLERILSISSNPGDLIMDVFVGSGTAAVAAERMGRRWIACDLSKFAIHTTRKRLLSIPECKPFEVLNLGNYQRQKFMESGETFASLSPGLSGYVKFILQLYRAEPFNGCTYLHGKKGSRLVYVSSVDGVVTEADLRAACEQCKSVGARGMDALGWDFEMGLHDLVNRIGSDYGVNIKLVQIPRECLEVRDPAREQVKFFNLNYLDVEATVKGKTLTVTLKDFVIANPEYVPDDVRKKIKRFSDYIDYWAVDFNFTGQAGDTFRNGWQSFRTRKHPELETRCTHAYEKAGRYKVLVKVVDVFGNDTTKMVEVTVK